MAIVVYFNEDTRVVRMYVREATHTSDQILVNHVPAKGEATIVYPGEDLPTPAEVRAFVA